MFASNASLKFQAALHLFKIRKGYSFFSLSDYFVENVYELVELKLHRIPGTDQSIENYVAVLEDIVANHTIPFKYWGLAEPSFA